MYIPLMLCALLGSTSAFAQDDPSADELARRIDLLAAELEHLRIGDAAAPADTSLNGMGPAASKVYQAQPGVSIGGYGEIKYANYSGVAQDGAPSDRVDRVDLHRLILYAGYKFNDRLILNTEIEFEHINELAVEFAYIDYQIGPSLGLRAGLLLVPMGITNELHEPTTFMAVNRPELERTLLPSTWSEIGVGAYGQLGTLSYRAYLISGLDATGFSAEGLRGGRQGGAKADAEDFAGVVRLDWSPTSGVLLGGSAYYGHAGQTLTDKRTGTSLSVPTLIGDLHAVIDVGGLRARLLYAAASLSDVARLNAITGVDPTDSVGTQMGGALAEVSYDLFGALGVSGRTLRPFVRYEQLDTQRSVPAGFVASASQRRSTLTAGAAYFPHEQVVLKLDYAVAKNDAQTGVNQLNAGVGFIF